MAALELLKEGCVRGSIRLQDVEDLLNNEDFTNAEGLLTKDDNQVIS